MKSSTKLVTFLLTLFTINALACEQPASVCFSDNGGLPLIKNRQPLPILISPDADPAVTRVAESFANDLQRVGGQSTTVSFNQSIDHPAVIIGVLGQNEIIDELVEEGKIEVSDIQGQWEAYKIAVVKEPIVGVEQVLVIIGSDRRGAIFGTLELSEQMGVSPWHWFADVPIVQQKNVYITSGTVKDQPKVRYRGIFINDEDPALKGWAQKKFGGVNAKMYEHMFDLILRLKGNYIWPAMWGKAFHLDDPKNTAMADNMGMVMGTSHHEPMTRAHAEWHRKSENPAGGGAWNYETNKENIHKFWQGGIERMMSKGDGTPYESLVTVGMRGDGDEPMSEGTAIELLEKVVEDQRKIIAEVTGKPANQTPQVWALYKEVLDYYDKGMTVPDDVTLLFADDNWGLVRRLPTENVDRAGGYGVYYHFDYVGVPRNYKWTNTVQIAKVWQQMNLSYERGARDLWVVNVGDLKPIEFPIDFFLTMAWDPEKMDHQAIPNYVRDFARQTFGDDLADEVANLLKRYGTYAAMRKPELLNQNTFEVGEVSTPKLTAGEFFEHYDKWQQLENDMEKVKSKINDKFYPTFFQLIEWPIASMSNLYEMYFAAAWNKKLVEVGDARANHFKKIVENNFERDKMLTDKYHSINEGKWDGMVNQVHMNYVTWNDPQEQTMPVVSTIYGGKNDIDVAFVRTAPPKHTQVIQAADFSQAHANGDLAWVKIEHLGQGKAGVIVTPQGTNSSKLEDNVSLTYQLDQPFYGNAKVTLQLSPTLDTYGRGGIRIGISIDDSEPEILTYDLHATGGAQRTKEEKAWAQAVITNKLTLEWLAEGLTQGKHKLKVYRIDDNVILEKIEINYLETAVL